MAGRPRGARLWTLGCLRLNPCSMRGNQAARPTGCMLLDAVWLQHLALICELDKIEVGVPERQLPLREGPLGG